jgi:hypothetical protein
MTLRRARANDNLLIVTLSDSEGSGGDSLVAEFTLSCTRFLATPRMTKTEGLPQNHSRKGLAITVKS